MPIFRTQIRTNPITPYSRTSQSICRRRWNIEQKTIILQTMNTNWLNIKSLQWIHGPFDLVVRSLWRFQNQNSHFILHIYVYFDLYKIYFYFFFSFFVLVVIKLISFLVVVFVKLFLILLFLFIQLIVSVVV